jgi:hypothetical protein
MSCHVMLCYVMRLLLEATELARFQERARQTDSIKAKMRISHIHDTRMDPVRYLILITIT